MIIHRAVPAVQWCSQNPSGCPLYGDGSTPTLRAWEENGGVVFQHGNNPEARLFVSRAELMRLRWGAEHPAIPWLRRVHAYLRGEP